MPKPLSIDTISIASTQSSQKTTISAQVPTSSPVELYAGHISSPLRLTNPALVWITAFPHTVDSRPHGKTNILLLSRDYDDLRLAQRNLRNPRKNPDHAINHLHRSALLQASDNILQRKLKRSKFCPRLRACRPIPPVQSKKEARDLDDAQDQRIADAFAEYLPPQLPPSLEEDMQFNAFYKNPVIHRARFPALFRAMVPAGWRGLSVHPADGQRVHVLELSEWAIQDLSLCWESSEDGEGWPEEDFLKTFLRRTVSCSSRYEIETPKEGARPLLPRRADTVESDRGNDEEGTEGFDRG
ncbi:MAG: hypothetical protein L6R39_005807 [Caloplaca ligustica]|nr:MAG: hypothetical protein L6R39_005807 [Caloplaca ligustica]